MVGRQLFPHHAHLWNDVYADLAGTLYSRAQWVEFVLTLPFDGQSALAHDAVQTEGPFDFGGYTRRVVGREGAGAAP